MAWKDGGIWTNLCKEIARKIRESKLTVKNCLRRIKKQ